MAGSEDFDRRTHASSAGATDLITKPISRREPTGRLSMIFSGLSERGAGERRKRDLLLSRRGKYG